VVQPCPYEGIEFLHGIDADLLSHRSELNEHVFCKALTLKLQTSKEVIEKIAAHYHAYFVAVLDQDEAAVRRQSKTLQDFSAHFDTSAVT
jgi:lipopolysaccharide biosynthesis protein